MLFSDKCLFLSMTTLVIEIPEKVEKTLADLIKQLGGKVISTGESSNITSKRRKQIIKDLDEAVDFVKQHQAGISKAKTMDELLDEL